MNRNYATIVSGGGPHACNPVEHPTTDELKNFLAQMLPEIDGGAPGNGEFFSPSWTNWIVIQTKRRPVRPTAFWLTSNKEK